MTLQICHDTFQDRNYKYILDFLRLLFSLFWYIPTFCKINQEDFEMRFIMMFVKINTNSRQFLENNILTI